VKSDGTTTQLVTVTFEVEYMMAFDRNYIRARAIAEIKNAVRNCVALGNGIVRYEPMRGES
jgi:soluble P-type ATPase